jgi:3-hydroxy-9,10-secoandrosta-1,3,5(10)-triene-9,17-dione monooxygenase
MGLPRGEMVERTQALIPLLREHREHSEVHARPAPEVVAACQRAGLFVMGAPEEAAGLEVPFPDQFEATALVAEVDPGVAWMMNNSAGLSRLAARMEPEDVQLVFKPPYGPYCQGLSPSGRLQPTPNEGGYSLEGTWPVLTGVLDAEWAMLACLLRSGDESPQLRFAVVRTADLEVNETWHEAVAVRGSGSHEVHLPATLIPASRVVDPAAPLVVDRPPFRLTGIVAVGTMATGLAVGFLRSAIGSAREELGTKVASITGQRTADSAIIQELMAEALVATNHLAYGTRALLQELTGYLDRDETPPIQLRATLAGSVFHGLDVARDLISRLYARSSRAAFFRGHTLQRAMADVHAMSYGFETIRAMYGQVGRVALGLEPTQPVI